MSRGKIQVIDAIDEILQHEFGDDFKAGNAINVCRCVEERVRLNSLSMANTFVGRRTL